MQTTRYRNRQFWNWAKFAKDINSSLPKLNTHTHPCVCTHNPSGNSIQKNRGPRISSAVEHLSCMFEFKSSVPGTIIPHIPQCNTRGSIVWDLQCTVTGVWHTKCMTYINQVEDFWFGGFVSGLHPMVLWANSWLSAEWSLLPGLQGLYGVLGTAPGQPHVIRVTVLLYYLSGPAFVFKPKRQ